MPVAMAPDRRSERERRKIFVMKLTTGPLRVEIDKFLRLSFDLGHAQAYCKGDRISMPPSMPPDIRPPEAVTWMLKPWLDAHVIPLLKGPPPVSFHSVLERQVVPEEGEEPDILRRIVLVWLLVTPAAWPAACQRLLEGEGFRFDFIRESEHGPSTPGQRPLLLFGGDGTPYANPEGMTMVRLWKRIDTVDLLLEVGAKHANGQQVADAFKAFFAQFQPLTVAEVYAKFKPPFGGA